MTMKAYPGGNGLQTMPATIRKLTDEELATRGATDKRPTFEIAMSSEAEVKRWFGIEILDHSEGAIDLTRFQSGGAVLMDHDRADQVGVIMSGTVKVGADRKMRGEIRFSSSARGQEIQRDVEDEIRQNISVGYYPSKTKLVEKRELGVDDSGRPITVDVWRVTRWQPGEVSIVSIPADVTVGVGRSDAEGRPPVEVEIGVTPEPKEERSMSKTAEQLAAEEQQRAAAAAAAVTAAAATVTVTDNRKDVAEIVRMCQDNGLAERAADWIGEGLTADQVGRKIVQEIKTRGNVTQGGESQVGQMPSKARRRYSYQRAIRIGAGLHPRAGTGGEQGDDFLRGVKFDGLEAEVHQELYRGLAQGVEYRGGILVPTDTRSPDEVMEAWEKRTHDTKTVAKGAELIREVPGEFIELLRKRAAVFQLGARSLTGLTGPVAFTKQQGGFTVYWVGENPAADVTESDVALGLVNLVPKTLQGAASYSRQLLIQASLDVEALVRDELAIGHGLAVDLSVIHGTGVDGQPTGVYNAPDVTITSFGGAVTYAKLVDQSTAVAEANADLGTLGYLTTPGIAGTCKKTLEFAAAGAREIWTGTYREGTIGGYRAVATNQVSSLMVNSAPTGGTEHGIVFGNWAEAIVGFYGSLELIVDPYAKKKRGLIEVASFQMADHIFRHGQSFNKSHGATK